MARKIILLSDGTGNSVAQVWRTNVWRTFERLDLSKSDQVAFYDDGVGTSIFKPFALLGGAFGYGLKRNVIALYKFACRNYRNTDDEIFLFGFSRGAFTVRIAVGLILDQGLVAAGSEQELDEKAAAAYRAYRRKFHTNFRIETPFRWLRDLFLRSDYSKENNRQNPTIKFLGLWDTVAAYGMPVEEIAQGIGQWLFNGSIDTSHGVPFFEATFAEKLRILLAAPLLRTISQPWFRIVARVGDKGAEEQYLRPDRSEPKFLINVPFTPTRSGELFLYVNDAVLGIPRLHHVFYGNNGGSSKVLIVRR